MHRLLAIAGLVALMLCTSSPAPSATKAKTTSSTTKVIDDFSNAKEPTDWSIADKAQLHADEGVLRVEIPQYRPGDPAAWPRATRDVSEIDFIRHNGLRLDLENPTDTAQLLQLSFSDGLGIQGQHVFRFAPHQRQTLEVRFAETQLSGSIDWSDVRVVELMRTQPATPMTWLVRRLELFTDAPDRTLFAELNERARKTSDALDRARTAKAMDVSSEREAAQTLQRWQQALRQPCGITGQIERCRNELSAVHGQILAALLAKQTGGRLAMWTVPLGTPFRPDEALLQFDSAVSELSIHSAKGQYEESIVRLTNLAGTTQDLQLQVQATDPAIRSALSVRRNQAVRATDKSVIGDALIPLDAAGVVSVGPQQTVELWIRLDTKYHACPAGVHRADLRIVDLRHGAASETKLPLSITVRDFDLASVSQEMKVQAWAELSAGRSFVVRGQEQAALEQLLDYGVNVLNLEPGQVPWPRLTADGELASPIDYAAHDQAMQFLRQKGNPLVLIFMNLDDNNVANWELRNGLAPNSEAWRRGMKNWLTDWTRHLQSLGLTTRDYALYFTDEPGPEELDRYRIVGQIVREIDPSIQIYINSGEMYHDAALNDALMEVTDIWQPDETVGFAADPNLLPALKKYPGKQLWVYACRTGMRSRRSNAHDYYRLMAWRAMRDGLTGIGYWSYCAAASSDEDLWDGTRVPASGAVLVYPGEKAPLSSVRWELVRQSIDDTKYVQLLRDLAEKTRVAGLKDRITALCGPRLAEVIEHRDEPGRVAQWRVEVGEVIEAAMTDKN